MYWKKTLWFPAQRKSDMLELLFQDIGIVGMFEGPNNAVLLEIMKQVATDNIQMTSEVMVGGGGG